MQFIERQLQRSARRLMTRTVAAALPFVSALPGLAMAQNPTQPYMDYSHPNVAVDLSVLDDSGLGGTPQLLGPAPGVPASGKLLIPGRQFPTSMLHVPMVSGEILKPVKRTRTPAAPVSLPKPTPEPAPAPTIAKAPEKAPPPKPAPVVVKAPEQPAPPPKPAPVAQVATAPQKLEAPAQPAEVKADAPPPAPTVPAPASVAKAPAAPKVAAETPPPPAPPIVKKKTPAKQQAALPPAKKADPQQDGRLRVTFGADQTKLPAAAKQKLLALAESLKGKENTRLQLLAYAGGPSLSSSLARRMSLSRALSIRSFLIANGVRSTRIDVRALGNKTDEEPLNRVDLNVTKR